MTSMLITLCQCPLSIVLGMILIVIHRFKGGGTKITMLMLQTLIGGVFAAL